MSLFDNVKVVAASDLPKSGRGKASDPAYDAFASEAVEKVLPHLTADDSRANCTKELRGLIRGRKGRDGKAMDIKSVVAPINTRLGKSGMRIARNGDEYFLATKVAQDETDETPENGEDSAE